MFNRVVILPAFLALLQGIAQPQSPLTCVTTSGNPALRAEGISESVGDIFLNCSGGTPGAARTRNLTVFLTVTVTNRRAAGTVTAPITSNSFGTVIRR